MIGYVCYMPTSQNAAKRAEVSRVYVMHHELRTLFVGPCPNEIVVQHGRKKKAGLCSDDAVFVRVASQNGRLRLVCMFCDRICWVRERRVDCIDGQVDRYVVTRKSSIVYSWIGGAHSLQCL